ncbi:MAG: SRPBCC family protein [Bdellovibrionota bacterium]
MSEKNKPNEIYITRMYDAPLKMVWEAWTDPKQKAKWWGPRGFTLTTHSSDVRTGGTWNYTMHGPDGVDYPNITKYLEVEKYSRMVYDHGGHVDRPPLFRVTVNFAEVSGKTKMEMTMALATAEAAAETKKFIKKAGGESTWDRLAEFLSDDDKFVINRSFDAPRELMFDMWTDPKHFPKWLPPTGMTMEFIRAEIKPGSSSFYVMHGANGMKMYGKVNYKEIRRPDLIVYTQQFCDENEKITRHPMAPTWPETMLTNVCLTEEGPNRTRVTITWQVHGQATSAERETFHAAKAGMAQGWGGSFEKLEDYLARR